MPTSVILSKMGKAVHSKNVDRTAKRALGFPGRFMSAQNLCGHFEGLAYLAIDLDQDHGLQTCGSEDAKTSQKNNDLFTSFLDSKSKLLTP